MELKQYVYDKLDEMKIQYYIINHKAMFSEKDTNLDDFDNDIMIGKNLFLRNKNKDKFYLIMLPLDKKADLGELANILKEKRLSFANEIQLEEHLKISPGSVSYLNVITAEKLDGNFQNVSYIIDKELLNSQKVGFHPSDNTATVVTTPESMLKVFDKYNLKYSVLDL